MRFVVAFILLALALPAEASTLREPYLRFVPSGETPEVALTLDACMGGADMRVLDVLIARRIPVTIFATRRWLLRNPETVRLLVAHDDLFQIEDHGAEHVPAVIGNDRPYGLRPAGTIAAVATEVLEGSMAISAATGRPPQWYRGATALYSDEALRVITSLGYRVGGFSLNGDLGASASMRQARERVASAQSGDVILVHMNQPKRPAGAGVARGILDLLARGVRFVRLDQVAEIDTAAGID